MYTPLLVTTLGWWWGQVRARSWISSSQLLASSSRSSRTLQCDKYYSCIYSHNIPSLQCSATWLVWVRGCVCGARRRPGYHGWPPPSQSVTSPPGELGSAGTGPPAHTAGSAEHKNFSHQSKRLPYNMHDGGQKLFFF